MKVLITGGTGLLGKSLIETAAGDYRIMVTHLGSHNPKDSDRAKYRVIDVRDKEGYADLYKEFRPDVTIHTAGIGSPDYAARHKEEAHDVNVGGTENILKNCEASGSVFVYISSNAVYDGGNAPYGEEDEARPINYYGQIKLEGEGLARRSRVPYSIVRPILMYGWNHPGVRQNIATLALSKFENGEEVFAYDDVFVNPVFAPICAKAIWKIIEKGKYGTFNIAGKDIVSIYGLVKKIAEVFEFDPGLVVPVEQGYFNELVRRPKNTSYNIEKMKRDLGVKPLSITEDLMMMKNSRECCKA